MSRDDLREFLKTVLPRMGYNWRRFERRNIYRRIRSRMESLRVQEPAKYAQVVLADASERAVLDSLLRLTITRFFRNAWLWSDLQSLVLVIAKDAGGMGPLSFWSAGCAGGEEPFSLAMLLDDLERTGGLSCPWTIVATDSDEAVRRRAEAAVYRQATLREVPRHLLDRWFREERGEWHLCPEVRHLVTFRRHDLLTMDPPGQFHMVFLRNSILTYNTGETQRRVLDRVRGCLLEPGYLVIGRTERIPEGVGFTEISKCIYRKT